MSALRSALPGMVWPAIPEDESARMLALQFQFDQSQWWPPEQIAAMQLRQFASIYAHALATVPYYRQRFESSRSEISGWPQYRELPLSTRQEIQQAGTALHSTAPPPAHGPLVRTESSGSTGRPLVTLGSAWTQLVWHALLLRDHLWHGRDLGGKLAAIRSSAELARVDNWGRATEAFATGPAVVRGISVDIDEQLRWLAQEDPDYLLAHATNIQALAVRSLELGIRLPKLKQARTYGEMLRPEARDIVREAWGVGIADSYSSEELGNIALQCPAGENYHVQDESLIVEVLDESGAPCQPGAVGQIVVSTLQNFSMPLIRYASGDFAEVAEPCACGRGLTTLRRVVGRQRNMLLRPDGVRYWPSFPVQKWGGTAPVRQIQLVQDAIDHVEARVVMPRDFSGDELPRFITALQECLGYPFRISCRRVDMIAPGAGGKYEDFVSLLVP
jgi:phenylacetate-CoA ligase